jgi:hypothetical protein
LNYFAGEPWAEAASEKLAISTSIDRPASLRRITWRFVAERFLQQWKAVTCVKNSYKVGVK